jgi:hypothetical protein
MDLPGLADGEHPVDHGVVEMDFIPAHRAG